MSPALASAGVWLLQTAALPDTILVKQVAPSMFEQVTDVAKGLISIVFLLFTLALVPAAFFLRKGLKRMNELLARIHGEITPLVGHATAVADDINYITTSIRGDVQRVNDTIATANERLRAAMDVTEKRLQEFNALLAVVQEEAEGVFVSTASTVRGVRTGAAAFRDGIGTDLAMNEDDLDDGEADLLSDVEEDNGDDIIPEAPAPRDLASERPTRPRVRRRRRLD